MPSQLLFPCHIFLIKHSEKYLSTIYTSRYASTFQFTATITNAQIFTALLPASQFQSLRNPQNVKTGILRVVTLSLVQIPSANLLKARARSLIVRPLIRNLCNYARTLSPVISVTLTLKTSRLQLSLLVFFSSEYGSRASLESVLGVLS